MKVKISASKQELRSSFQRPHYKSTFALDLNCIISFSTTEKKCAGVSGVMMGESLTASTNCQLHHMDEFIPLTTLLADHFEKTVVQLPEPLQRRVINDLDPVMWDISPAEHRRRYAMEEDARFDPARSGFREKSSRLIDKIFELDAEIQRVRGSATPTATSIKDQRNLITELEHSLKQEVKRYAEWRTGFDLYGNPKSYTSAPALPDPELALELARIESLIKHTEEVESTTVMQLLHKEQDLAYWRMEFDRLQAAVNNGMQEPVVGTQSDSSPPGSAQDACALGSSEWRSQNARKAANALHDKPGGSRDKQKQIQERWASGKYTSKDRCAEEECAALGMSFAAARRALRNQPNPSRS